MLESRKRSDHMGFFMQFVNPKAALFSESGFWKKMRNEFRGPRWPAPETWLYASRI
jgi:hypothetical protein